MVEWFMLVLIWAVVEFIQFMRKRPYPARMRTGAIWGTVFLWMAFLGQMTKKTMDDHYWSGMLTALAMAGAMALVIYGMRILLAKGWARIKPKKEEPLN
jgi:hypothetical protein